MAAGAASLSAAAPEWSFPSASLHTNPRNVRRAWASSRALQSPSGHGDLLLSVPQNPQAEQAGVWELLGERRACKDAWKEANKGGREEEEEVHSGFKWVFA